MPDKLDDWLFNYAQVVCASFHGPPGVDRSQVQPCAQHAREARTIAAWRLNGEPVAGWGEATDGE